MQNLKDSTQGIYHQQKEQKNKKIKRSQAHDKLENTLCNIDYQTKECRICLEDNTSSVYNKFIDPCNCTGSVKYVHESCYKQWIESSFKIKNQKQKEIIMQSGIQCEICKIKIHLQFKSQYNIYTCQQFGDIVKKTSILFSVSIFLLIVHLGIIFWILIFGRHLLIQFTQSIQNSIIFILLIVLTVTFIILLYKFIIYYALYKVDILDKIISKQHLDSNKAVVIQQKKMPLAIQEIQ